MDHQYCQGRLWCVWRGPFHSPSCDSNLLCQRKLLSQYGNLSLSSFCLRCAQFNHHNACVRCDPLHGLNMVHRCRILLRFFSCWIHHWQKVPEGNGGNSETTISLKAAYVKLKYSLSFWKTTQSLRRGRTRKWRLWLQKHNKVKQSILGSLWSSFFFWSCFGPVFWQLQRHDREEVWNKLHRRRKNDHYPRGFTGCFWVCASKDLFLKSQMEKKVSVGIFDIVFGLHFMDLLFAKHNRTHSNLLHCNLHFFAFDEHNVRMWVLCTFGINFLLCSQIRAWHSICGRGNMFGVESMYRAIGKYRNLKSIHGPWEIIWASVVVRSRIGHFPSHICHLDVRKRVWNTGLQFERRF